MQFQASPPCDLYADLVVAIILTHVRRHCHKSDFEHLSAPWQLPHLTFATMQLGSFWTLTYVFGRREELLPGLNWASFLACRQCDLPRVLLHLCSTCNTLPSALESHNLPILGHGNQCDAEFQAVQIRCIESRVLTSLGCNYRKHWFGKLKFWYSAYSTFLPYTFDLELKELLDTTVDLNCSEVSKRRASTLQERIHSLNWHTPSCKCDPSITSEISCQKRESHYQRVPFAMTEMTLPTTEMSQRELTLQEGCVSAVVAQVCEGGVHHHLQVHQPQGWSLELLWNQHEHNPNAPTLQISQSPARYKGHRSHEWYASNHIPTSDMTALKLGKIRLHQCTTFRLLAWILHRAFS